MKKYFYVLPDFTLLVSFRTCSKCCRSWESSIYDRSWIIL